MAIIDPLPSILDVANAIAAPLASEIEFKLNGVYRATRKARRSRHPVWAVDPCDL
jgi:hypothetical protein